VTIIVGHDEEIKVWRWWICILCCPRRCNCQYSFIDSDALWTGSEALDLAACLMFGGWSLDLAWGLHFGSSVRGCHQGRRWKNLDRILCIFYFTFSYVIWECTMSSFNIIRRGYEATICFKGKTLPWTFGSLTWQNGFYLGDMQHKRCLRSRVLSPPVVSRVLSSPVVSHKGYLTLQQ
jgi:hypothetical protein